MYFGHFFFQKASLFPVHGTVQLIIQVQNEKQTFNFGHFIYIELHFFQVTFQVTFKPITQISAE